MMGKEHVIEELGVPDFTVSMGTSGGAYTSLQIADEFPGLFDGILINATFPDALSIALAAGDARGARPTVFDAAINIYGADPKTGFALRVFDNVGVQYGLAALHAGTITPTRRSFAAAPATSRSRG